MCKNFAAFIAGAAALSFLGLGGRIFIVDRMMGARVQAVCPLCEIVLLIAAFALPFLIGMFIGAFSGGRGWFCASLAAVTALVVRSAVAGPSPDRMIHTPLLAGLSVLYVALAAMGGTVGTLITSRRSSQKANERFTPAPVAPHTPGAAQSHDHDNLAF